MEGSFHGGLLRSILWRGHFMEGCWAYFMEGSFHRGLLRPRFMEGSFHFMAGLLRPHFSTQCSKAASSDCQRSSHPNTELLWTTRL